ncbi:response regulator [Limibacter armeniacum]|uniref:response regulator n=1 Tax=Limibacter armeniacum TaxID=466084 RepID=UPI002FE5E0DD
MPQVKRVFVIDDDDIFNFGISRMLIDSRFAEKVSIFSNGEDARDFLQQILPNDEQWPDVIFLDLRMPVMNGWKFIYSMQQELETLSKKTGIYVVSSSCDLQDKAYCLQYPFISAYIEKPITLSKLRHLFETDLI